MDPTAKTLKGLLVRSIVGSVVNRDENKGVIPQPEFIQRDDQPTDQMVRIPEHSGKMFARRQLLPPVVRRWHNRYVRQNR